MKKNALSSFVLCVVITVAVFYSGCSKSDTSPGTIVTPKIKIDLKTSATLGQYLVDKNGVTLYFFSNDFKGRNTCLGGCEAYWPYFSGGTLTQDSLATGLNLADFDTVHINGVVQTRYKGWPLYYFSPTGNGVPESAGQTSGEGSQGIWFVAKPDYTIMIANGQLMGLDGNNYTSTYTVGTGSTLYFTDAKGLTLYTFTPDSFNVNKFTKADFSNNAAWPIYDTTKMVVPSVLDKSLFSTTTIAGHMQLTYKGWPLYHFGQDGSVKGSTKGVSVPVAGKWPVAVKAMNAAPQKQTTTTTY